MTHKFFFSLDGYIAKVDVAGSNLVSRSMQKVSKAHLVNALAKTASFFSQGRNWVYGCSAVGG